MLLLQRGSARIAPPRRHIASDQCGVIQLARVGLCHPCSCRTMLIQQWPRPQNVMLFHADAFPCRCAPHLLNIIIRRLCFAEDEEHEEEQEAPQADDLESEPHQGAVSRASITRALSQLRHWPRALKGARIGPKAPFSVPRIFLYHIGSHCSDTNRVSSLGLISNVCCLHCLAGFRICVSFALWARPGPSWAQMAMCRRR